MHRRWQVMLLVLGILLPGILAVYFVKKFGVNVPVHDEWHFMSTVNAFYSGSQWRAALFDHYGEHRIPVPKAIILGLAPFTKYNVKDEMYLSVLLMMLGAFVLWRLLKKTNAPSWLIVPIGWLFISTAQNQNLLVGWQFQIPLMNFFVLLTILLLNNEPLRARDQLAAAATAFIATFSFANGLLIWPVIVLYVAFRKRSFRKALPWLVLMIVAGGFYLGGLPPLPSHADRPYAGLCRQHQTRAVGRPRVVHVRRRQQLRRRNGDRRHHRGRRSAAAVVAARDRVAKAARYGGH